MSVSLNKPGLAKLNMKNNSLGSASFKVATANKLSTSTRTGFGIMAQRTKVGSGTIFNVKAYNSDSISANRHALNDNRTIIRNNNFVGVPYHTENNSMNKYAAALAVTSMLAQTLGQLGSLTSSSNVPTNNPKNNGNEKLSASSKDLTSLNAMRKATDSTTLREAIETAKSEQSSMQSELTQLEAQLPSMKEASEAATKQLQDLEPKVSEKEKDVKQKENTVAEKESVLSAAEKDKKSKLKVAKNMEAAVGEAA